MIQFDNHTITQEDLDVLLDEKRGLVAHIIVYNDDVNTFDWVIKCFVEICDHTETQSEQLAMLIHFKGKATVKTGSREELMPMKEALIDRGLSAVLKEDEV